LVFLLLAITSFTYYGAQEVQAANASAKRAPFLASPLLSEPYWTFNTTKQVAAVAVSADGGTIVTGTILGGVFVFDRQSNATLWTYNSSNALSRSVAVSANGGTIVVGDTYGIDTTFAIRVFSRDSNTTLWTYKGVGYINSVAISADGDTIAVGHTDGLIRVFGRQSNTTLWTYDTSDFVETVAVSADGNTIVEGGQDSTIRVFSRQNNATLWTYYTGYDSVVVAIVGVAVSSDGNTIVTGAVDGVIRVFSRGSNTTLWTYNAGGYGKLVYGVAASSNGSTIAAGGLDQHLRVFGRNSNATLIDHNTGGNIYRTVATSSDGSIIASANSAGVNSKAFLYSKNHGQLWNYTVGKNMGDQPNSGPDVAVSVDGTLAAYGSDNGKIYVFAYDVAPPVVGSPTVSPSSPIEGQKINVSISVTDNFAVSTVTLYYKFTSSSSWNLTTLILSGAVYKATLGPYVAGENITFYINATDTYSNFACSPSNAPSGYYSIAIGPAEHGGQGLPITFIVLAVGVFGIVAVVGVVLLVVRGKGRKK
jgi:WD40 repeat protein